jgi:hypothetical protein
MQAPSSFLWRAMLVLIGTTLVLIPIGGTFLLAVGKSAPANVNLRRVRGSDPGRTPDQRYEWAVDYTFMGDDGRRHEGHATRRGSDIGIKVEPRIRYLAWAPSVNALDQDLEPELAQLALLACGGLLLRLGFKRAKNRPARADK